MSRRISALIRSLTLVTLAPVATSLQFVPTQAEKQTVHVSPPAVEQGRATSSVGAPPAVPSTVAAGMMAAPSHVKSAPRKLHPEARLRQVLAAAWQDATATWSRLLDRRVYENDIPQINFVGAIRPSHCYGLYVGAGPVYCSGNNTVFVSMAEMKRLSERIGGEEGTGLTILVAHELGHHIQKVTGRFRVLGSRMRANPQFQRQLAMRFELEADCLAGVWASNSSGYAAQPIVRRELAKAIDAIGDDKVQLAANGVTNPAHFTHGTAAQRSRWFNVGLASGDPRVCNVLDSKTF